MFGDSPKIRPVHSFIQSSCCGIVLRTKQITIHSIHIKMRGWAFGCSLEDSIMHLSMFSPVGGYTQGILTFLGASGQIPLPGGHPNSEDLHPGKISSGQNYQAYGKISWSLNKKMSNYRSLKFQF